MFNTFSRRVCRKWKYVYTRNCKFISRTFSYFSGNNSKYSQNMFYKYCNSEITQNTIVWMIIVQINNHMFYVWYQRTFLYVRNDTFKIKSWKANTLKRVAEKTDHVTSFVRFLSIWTFVFDLNKSHKETIIPTSKWYVWV